MHEESVRLRVKKALLTKFMVWYMREGNESGKGGLDGERREYSI